MNPSVQDVFKKYNLEHYWSFNDDMKAACVKKFNRTLKTRLFRYMTSRHTKRWIDVLSAFIDSYNKSLHRTIGMPPNDVTLENSLQIADRIFPPKMKPHWKFQFGNKVRISKYKHIFVKGFLQNWTYEIFVLTFRHESNPATYGLNDLLGEEIKRRLRPGTSEGDQGGQR